MVRWCHNDVGIGILGQDVKGGVRDCRGRVPADRLQQDLILGEFGQLRTGDAGVGIVGDNENILQRDDLLEPVERGLQQGTSRAEEIEKLLGLVFLAKRPESAAHSTAHDYAIIVIVSHY